MKVFVTGGCGFLGSNVCEFYRKKGWEVVSFDNLTKHELARTGFATAETREYNWNFLNKLGVKLIKGDVRRLEEVLDSSSGCDYIIHTAAQPAMTISWEDPLLDASTNVMGTVHVLEAARKHRIPVAACATIHIYGNRVNETLTEGDARYLRTPAGIDESHPTLEGTLTPLHASKGAGDIYVRTYIDTFKLEAASFRLTGIYGPRQFGGEDHGWVANFAIRSMLHWPITIFGTGKQIRDIIFATDVCEAFDAFFRHRRPGIYNIGGGERTAISLLECLDILRDVTREAPEVKMAPDRHGDLRYFICDITKARQHLEWSPQVLPRDGIERLVHWIRENPQVFQAR